MYSRNKINKKTNARVHTRRTSGNKPQNRSNKRSKQDFKRIKKKAQNVKGKTNMQYNN